MQANKATNNQKISLLLSDIDGTLVTKTKVLTDRTRQAVYKLYEMGIQFAITSARAPIGMQKFIEPLKLTAPLACFNGGLIVQPDLSVMESNVLRKDVAQQVIAAIKEYGLDVWVYRGNEWYVSNRACHHVDREKMMLGIDPVVTSKFADVSENIAKIVAVGDDYDLVARCEAYLQEKFVDSASAARSRPYYLDVTSPLANKGQVVRAFAKYLEIDQNQIATIGDMPTDVLMFKQSGLSVAMGNASPDVQKQATYVTDSNEDEGFAKAVEKYLLKTSVV